MLLRIDSFAVHTTSDRHNFHTGAPIDAPFAATRSLSLPIRFYTTCKQIDSELSESVLPLKTFSSVTRESIRGRSESIHLCPEL
ncbi:hypothetical protein PIB30_059730 [Stylosanthes scabra]|uniref:Uncharacterized protein n=1 Tax=Stylosanthes scabra TaxID=79078 RepID=A0ABU6RKD0_9FABA|nr:hypothetical protein [Stylosanthes scabra]